MANKYVPTKEELNRLLIAYKKTKTYSGAAKECHLSVTVATRLIKENINQEVIEIKEPAAEPPILTNYYLLSEEWRTEYYNV